ncbi:cytochrome P450 [Sphingobium sp.]|uniref:cytochrome P450 n=1 Tax=Sphingobium sp. TaxID=1912891 RepID=UPI0028BEBBA0|nr:cytochrome P450 [Sphingobium sp.]
MSSIGFDARDMDFVQNPYPFYRRLRDEAPAYHHEESGLWFISRFTDVERAATDHATFSSSRGNVVIDSPTRVGKTLGSMDPPRHDELRRIIQRSLAPARIEAILPFVREETRARLAAFADNRRCDLVADIGRPILFGALGRMLGLDAVGASKATELTAGLFHQDDGLLGSVLQPEDFQAIFAFLGEEMSKRTVEKGDDLISVLLEAQANGAPLNDQEIVANLSTVLMAGNASIGHFFPNLMHALWLHPDQRRLVREDPSRILAAIEESVRWDTSTQSFARHVMQDVEIAGQRIPAGSRALVLFASANRDERSIPEPDRFDIERKRVRHFGFGLGPHVCAGTQVARAMLREMLQVLLPVMGDFDLDTANAERVKHVMVRGFINLGVEWK